MRDDGGHFESGDEYGSRAANVPPADMPRDSECPNCYEPLIWPFGRDGYCWRCNKWFSEKDLKKTGRKKR